MFSMRSQHKMPAFSSNFRGDKIFCKPKVSADFWVNRPKFRGNCVFYLQEKDGMAAHFEI